VPAQDEADDHLVVDVDRDHSLEDERACLPVVVGCDHLVVGLLVDADHDHLLDVEVGLLVDAEVGRPVDVDLCYRHHAACLPVVGLLADAGHDHREVLHHHLDGGLHSDGLHHALHLLVGTRAAALSPAAPRQVLGAC